MHPPVLATKLYVPPPRPDAVVRHRLVERLDEGRRRKLTLVLAPAGFGKTTLVSGWVSRSTSPVAWLSLDEEHTDVARFLTTSSRRYSILLHRATTFCRCSVRHSRRLSI